MIKTAQLFLVVCGAIACSASRISAEVVRVDVAERAAFGNTGYEKIVGTIHFAIDPSHLRNQVIADLNKAPKNSAGRVEFSADLYILRPRDAARSNGVALIEVSNRGNKGMPFGRPSGGLSFSTEPDLGDGFLTKAGYTLVWVGWQFDVARDGGRMKLDAPVADVSSIVRAEFTPTDRSPTQRVVDLGVYSPLDPDGAETTLTVRKTPYDKPAPIARDRWHLAENTVTMPAGLEPGRIYELAYRPRALYVAGVGLAALRDTASWLKYQPDALAPVRFAYAYGTSQSGRVLRSFLYDGFNSDEKDRLVFDGVLAHIAGAARINLNQRGATPNATQLFGATAFPYADVALQDPISGKTEGLLENDRARSNQPKIFYTNTSVEYWGGTRSAALIHTTADGQADLRLPDNVRIYFLTGAQHVPGPFPPQVSPGHPSDNPLEYGWTLRALLVAMDRWIREGTVPPASQYPRLADGTLVRADQIVFPLIPDMPSPRAIILGRLELTKVPLLVPAVDEDGNERAGIRTPEQSVPVATYTGWNYRNGLLGSFMPFPKSKAARVKTGDPRRSMEERYPSKDEYLVRARARATALVKDRYLLPEDVENVMERIEKHWQEIH